MTAPRPRRPARPRTVASDGVSVVGWLWWRLVDVDPPDDAGRGALYSYQFVDEDVLREAWRTHGPAILARWIDEQPGTRPSCWFAFDAPRMFAGRFPGCYYDGQFPELRLRIGGRGTPEFDCANVVPTFWCGLPASWASGGWVDYLHRQGKSYAVQRFDPADPPKYESQASYLRRFKLFARNEERRVQREHLAPEVLPDHLWPLTEEELRDA